MKKILLLGFVFILILPMVFSAVDWIPDKEYYDIETFDNISNFHSCTCTTGNGTLVCDSVGEYCHWMKEIPNPKTNSNFTVKLDTYGISDGGGYYTLRIGTSNNTGGSSANARTTINYFSSVYNLVTDGSNLALDFSFNVWKELELRFSDGGTYGDVTIYVNGTNKGNDQFTSSVSTLFLQFGYSANNHNYKIDNLWVYNGSVIPSEIPPVFSLDWDNLNPSNESVTNANIITFNYNLTIDDPLNVSLEVDGIINQTQEKTVSGVYEFNFTTAFNTSVFSDFKIVTNLGNSTIKTIYIDKIEPNILAFNPNVFNNTRVDNILNLNISYINDLNLTYTNASIEGFYFNETNPYVVQFDLIDTVNFTNITESIKTLKLFSKDWSNNTNYLEVDFIICNNWSCSSYGSCSNDIEQCLTVTSPLCDNSDFEGNLNKFDQVCESVIIFSEQAGIGFTNIIIFLLIFLGIAGIIFLFVLDIVFDIHELENGKKFRIGKIIFQIITIVIGVIIMSTLVYQLINGMLNGF